MALGFGTYAGVAFHKSIDLNMSIFKFIKVGNLLDSLEDNYLYLKNIIYWDDTWELPFRYFNTDNSSDQVKWFFGQYNRFQDSRNQVFASCFTSEYDSDAMWRIYSHQKDCVCIRTNPKLLLQEMTNSVKETKTVYFAKVIYFNTADLSAKELFTESKIKQYPLEMYSALLKRSAFEHEKELRLIVKDPEYIINSPTKELKLDFNLRSIVSEIILDPRLSTNEVNLLKRGLEKYKIPVTQSQLYSLPKFTIQDYENEINVCAKHPGCIGGTMFGILED